VRTFIFGAAGFAKEVEWLIYEINCGAEQKIEITGFVTSDSDFKIGEYINSIPIISENEYFQLYNKTEQHNCIIALGNPVLRNKVYDKIKNGFTTFPTLVHPSVIFDKRENQVVFGIGSIICTGCILTTKIIVGNFVHLNLDATVGHDSIISDFVTISPSVNISGKVKVNSGVFIGTGVKINENLEICKNVILGSGAVVNKNIIEAGTYVGVPVSKVK